MVQVWSFPASLIMGGHSTYRLIVQPGCPEFNVHWKKLENLGCTHESATLRLGIGKRILYSIDIPKYSDIYAVYSLIEEGQRKNIWMFEEGHVGHKLKSQ